MDDMYCVHCRQSAKRLALLAMMQTAGAQVYPGPDICPARKEELDHEFAVLEPAKETTP